jgi:hypothetical protein
MMVKRSASFGEALMILLDQMHGVNRARTSWLPRLTTRRIDGFVKLTSRFFVRLAGTRLNRFAAALHEQQPNLALNLAPFGRWTLRDKAAQRRLA